MKRKDLKKLETDLKVLLEELAAKEIALEEELEREEAAHPEIAGCDEWDGLFMELEDNRSLTDSIENAWDTVKYLLRVKK